MYSQLDEEQYILENVPETGRFLDVGAWSAYDMSNTRRLYEMGWSGVLIEPSPGPFLQIMLTCSKCLAVAGGGFLERKGGKCDCGSETRYGNDPRIQLVLAALDTSQSLVKMHATDYPSTTALTSNYEKWKGELAFYGEYFVPQINWQTVFNQFDKFDFVNIDAEGRSAHLFFSLLEMKEYLPGCICLEHEDRVIEIQQRACKVGYKTVYTNGTNLIMVLK